MSDLHQSTEGQSYPLDHLTHKNAVATTEPQTETAKELQEWVDSACVAKDQLNGLLQYPEYWADFSLATVGERVGREYGLSEGSGSALMLATTSGIRLVADVLSENQSN